jgi:exodeoxyribonuclease VII small subunit
VAVLAVPGRAGLLHPDAGHGTEADYNQGFTQPMAKQTPQSPSPSQGLPAPASYEEALAELEALVGAMERGEMQLDRLLESYRRGAELLAFCRGRLEAVEAQVKLLDEGQLKPWSAGAPGPAAAFPA